MASLPRHFRFCLAKLACNFKLLHFYALDGGRTIESCILYQVGSVHRQSVAAGRSRRHCSERNGLPRWTAARKHEALRRRLRRSKYENQTHYFLYFRVSRGTSASIVNKISEVVIPFIFRAFMESLA